MPEIKLIAGLGNPGEKYAGTRHNAGFRTLDLLAAGSGVRWKNWKDLAQVAAAAGDTGVILAKPQTFMNNSGQAVAALMSYYRIAPREVLVVVDDFAIPLGHLRLRAGGSAGGHNGLASIIEHVGTSDFPRLRLGIGPVPPGWDSADFVLSRFSTDEEKAVDEMIRRAAATVNDVLVLGLDKAVSRIVNSDKETS